MCHEVSVVLPTSSFFLPLERNMYTFIGQKTAVARQENENKQSYGFE